MHRIESANDDNLRSHTQVRKRYYDDEKWNHLIDRGAIPSLVSWDESAREMSYEVVPQ